MASRRVVAARFRANRGGRHGSPRFYGILRFAAISAPGCGEFKINAFGRPDKRAARDAEIFARITNSSL